MTVQRNVMFSLTPPPIVHWSLPWEMRIAYATRHRPTAPYFLAATHLARLRFPRPAIQQKEEPLERWLMVRLVSRLLALVVHIKFWGAGGRIRFKSWYILDGQPGRRRTSCACSSRKYRWTAILCVLCLVRCIVKRARYEHVRETSTAPHLTSWKERIRLVVSVLELVNWLSVMANSPPVVPEFSQGTKCNRDVRLKSRVCSAKPIGAPVLLLLLILLPLFIKAVASLEVSVWWHLSAVCWAFFNPKQETI